MPSSLMRSMVREEVKRRLYLEMILYSDLVPELYFILFMHSLRADSTGRVNAFITGKEGAAAMIVGVRRSRGEELQHDAPTEGRRVKIKKINMTLKTRSHRQPLSKIYCTLKSSIF